MRRYFSTTIGLLLVAMVLLCGGAKASDFATTTPIQEAKYVTLGGIEQWITIRGADRANPVLLLIHGGPGDAQSALRSTYAVYEKDFTIVQWDQRGAGRTYLKNPNSPPVPERVELDGIELAQYLCAYLTKKKILLLGHSWGSHLGVEMVQRRPELFAAYVGTGQVGSWRASVRAQFDFMLAQSRRANDRQARGFRPRVGAKGREQNQWEHGVLPVGFRRAGGGPPRPAGIGQRSNMS